MELEYRSGVRTRVFRRKEQGASREQSGRLLWISSKSDLTWSEIGTGAAFADAICARKATDQGERVLNTSRKVRVSKNIPAGRHRFRIGLLAQYRSPLGIGRYAGHFIQLPAPWGKHSGQSKKGMVSFAFNIVFCRWLSQVVTNHP